MATTGMTEHEDPDSPLAIVQSTANMLMYPIFQTCDSVKKVTQMIKESQATQDQLLEMQTTGQLTTGQIIGMRRIERRAATDQVYLQSLGIKLDRIGKEIDSLDDKTASHEKVDKILYDIRSLLHTKFGYQLAMNPVQLNSSPVMLPNSDLVMTGAGVTNEPKSLPDMTPTPKTSYSSESSRVSGIPKVLSRQRSRPAPAEIGGTACRSFNRAAEYSMVYPSPEPSFSHRNSMKKLHHGHRFGSEQSIASSVTSSVSTHCPTFENIRESQNFSGTGTFTTYSRVPQLVSSTPRRPGRIEQCPQLEPHALKSGLSPIPPVELSFVSSKLRSSVLPQKLLELGNPIITRKNAELEEHNILMAKFLGKKT